MSLEVVVLAVERRRVVAPQVRSRSMISSVRAPRSRTTSRGPSNSRSDHPTPTPIVSRPPLSASRLASMFASSSGLCWGSDEHARAEPDPVGDRGRPRERDDRIEQVRRRIALLGRMHDVIAHPDVGEPELLRVLRRPPDRVGDGDASVLTSPTAGATG